MKRILVTKRAAAEMKKLGMIFRTIAPQPCPHGCRTHVGTLSAKNDKGAEVIYNVFEKYSHEDGHPFHISRLTRAPWGEFDFSVLHCLCHVMSGGSAADPQKQPTPLSEGVAEEYARFETQNSVELHRDWTGDDYCRPDANDLLDEYVTANPTLDGLYEMLCWAFGGASQIPQAAFTAAGKGQHSNAGRWSSCGASGADIAHKLRAIELEKHPDWDEVE